MGIKQEIEIIIDPSGEVRLHVQGVNGAKCLGITRDLQEALGRIVRSQTTSEYYKPEEEEGINIKPKNNGTTEK